MRTLPPSTKVIRLKSTLRWRESVQVVVLHSMSTRRARTASSRFWIVSVTQRVLQLREAELGADAARDLAAQVDRVTLRLALRVGEGERRGVVDVAERDRAARADLLERSGLGGGGRGERARQGEDEQCVVAHGARILGVRGAACTRANRAAAR